MQPFRANSSTASSSFSKTPYSRMSMTTSNGTVGKILNKVRTAENSYGRSPVPQKHLISKDHYNQNISTVNNNDYKIPDENVYDDSFLLNHSTEIRNPNSFTGRFRPRTPLMQSLKSVKQNLDQIVNHVDLEMMSLGDSNNYSKRHQKPSTNTDSDLALRESFPTKNQENVCRLFTGTVENVIYWSKLKNSFQMLFEVIGTLDSIAFGKWNCEKILTLSESKNSPALQVVYYEIDRPLPNFPIKSTITCIGRLITRNRLQAFKIEESSHKNKAGCQHFAFICNRVAEELVQKKELLNKK